MRIALVSDIHGNLAALEAVAADIKRRGVDQILCLGDNVSGPLLPRETAQYLMQSSFVVLAGNHERQVLAYERVGGGASDGYAHSQLTKAEFDWLRTLRPEMSLSTEIFICHGTPRSDCEHFLESVRHGSLSVATQGEVADRIGSVGAAVIACGHSHVPRSLRSSTGQLLVNSGSVGLQAYTGDEPESYSMELGTPDAHYAIVEKTPGGWTSSHHAIPYDHLSMAALARKRNRPEWEKALLSGYVV